MSRRPHSITVISVLFLAAGAVGLAYHAADFRTQERFQYALIWVCLLRPLAILGAVFMLRGRNWARWLLVMWMAYHVILSAFHSPSELIVHGLLLGIVTWFLFWRPALIYFRGARADTVPTDAHSASR